ncbi:MAG: ATP-binding cassette domain-containing protein [Chloroflexi bacterium]|nr:MAG: ATP-binding cassette domain-containing protein [Chloroflexota bacterium]MBL1193463.1 ATP-binding cassette domain-containing protein [Chloroflexota bacterium]NOH10754.1 ATP-binding cassette domain-containing protein [Chloroflexota bacterium]
MRVELNEIRKYFGPVKANDGITITFEEGNIYGLLGENGAGKSTLMKILSGFQPFDSGELLLNGSDATFTSPREALAAGIGMLYQEPLDLPPFTILDNYLLGRDNKVIPDRQAAIQELIELTQRYNFDVDIKAHIDSLSVGERQQLELVRLLAGGAEVLILDEPTTGISAEQKDLLFASMRKLAKEENKTLILVSHKLSEVQELCDHAFVLRKGQMVGETDVPCPNEKLVEMMFGQLPERSPRPSVSLEDTMLSIKEMAIRTYRLSVEGLQLDVRSGEVIGLAGLEGSGQGLFLKACAGLLRPAKGSIQLADKDITNHSYHATLAEGVGYLAAGRLEEGLVAGLTLTEHMILGALERKFMIDWESSREETSKRIEHYQVIGTEASTADQLSGGNQQRLLFSLLNTPLRLILMEQPTRGLDVRSADYIWEQLYERRKDGTAIIFISPDLDEILDRSDRIAVFYGGQMLKVVEASETNVDELGHLIGGEL